MKVELPGPGVEHGRDAELGPEALRIAAEGEECLGSRSHEQCEHPTAVREGDGAQSRRKCEGR
jgi:hypothetical protein